MGYGTTNFGIRGGHGSCTAASGSPQINISGSQSLDFWIKFPETTKPGYLNTIDYQSEIWRSGVGPNYPQADTFWKVSLRTNGDLTWKVGNQTLMKSGVDVGRWNHIYCEYDEPNSRIGLSVNAASKIYANYSGGIPNYSSNLHLSNIKCDELGIWSGILSSDQIEEHYSNFRGYSYSGSLNTQWMYPQSDVYVSSSGAFYDFPSAYGKWYQDELQIVEVPFGRRWEYLNEAEDIAVSYYMTDSLYTRAGGFDAAWGAKIRAGLGKLLVKPSSIKAYVNCQLTQMDVSGYLSEVYLYDKYNKVIASGIGDVNNQKFTFQTGGSIVNPSPLSLQFIDAEDKDFSDVSSSFGFRSLEGFTTTLAIQNLSLFVSGVSIAYTGLNLIGSGGIDRNNYVDLYTQAYSSGSRSLDLYLAGHLPTNSGIPLYVYGHQPINSGVDLYTYGWDTRSSGVDLSIQGSIALNSGIDLYTYGSNIERATLNLFTKNEPIESSGGLGLFTFAATDPTVQRGIDLYLKTALASSQVGTLSMSISGPEFGSYSDQMPLYLENNTLTYGHVELFLQNAYQSGFKGLRLYTNGEGTLNGGLPYGDSMPLFIERTEGVQGGLSMFVQANNGVSSGVNLVTKGGTYATSGLDMSIPSVYDKPSGILQLFVRGY